MGVREAVMALLDAQQNQADQKLVGRTVFQKKLYFLSVLSGENFGFVPYHYGPYSPSGSSQIEALQAAGFIQEDAQPTGRMVGPTGESVRYVYSLSQSGIDILESRPEITEQYELLINKINNHEIANNPKLLPIAAKVHFIVSEKGKASVATIRERARSLNWDISQDEITKVVAYLKHLKLLK